MGKKIQNSCDPNCLINQLIHDQNANAFFTDGSKSGTSISVGSACFCDELNETVSRSGNKITSTFTAECIALNDAVNIALINPNRNVLVFTDSLNTLISLENASFNLRTNPYIYQIREKVYDFSIKTKNKYQIKFYWVPAHLGIKRNERTDILAKHAATIEASKSLGIPFTDFRESFKKGATTHTQNVIENEGLSKGQEYFRNFYSRKSKTWFTNKNLPREIISIINRYRAGHYNLASSLARVGLTESPHCQCGNEYQNIDYIL